MKKLLIIGASKFIGKSFIKYFDKNRNKINLILISRKELFYKKKNKNIKIIKKDFKKIKKIPECDYLIYCLRTNTKKKDDELFKFFEKKIKKIKKETKNNLHKLGSCLWTK